MVEVGCYLPEGGQPPSTEKKPVVVLNKKAINKPPAVRTRVQKRNLIKGQQGEYINGTSQVRKQKGGEASADSTPLHDISVDMEKFHLRHPRLVEVSLSDDESHKSDVASLEDDDFHDSQQPPVSRRKAVAPVSEESDQNDSKDPRSRFRPPSLIITDSTTAAESQFLTGNAKNKVRLNTLIAEMAQLKADAEALKDVNATLERDRKIELARMNLQVAYNPVLVMRRDILNMKPNDLCASR